MASVHQGSRGKARYVARAVASRLYESSQRGCPLRPKLDNAGAGASLLLRRRAPVSHDCWSSTTTSNVIAVGRLLLEPDDSFYPMAMMLATDGIPAVFTNKSMYAPGGAT